MTRSADFDGTGACGRTNGWRASRRGGTRAAEGAEQPAVGVGARQRPVPAAPQAGGDQERGATSPENACGAVWLLQLPQRKDRPTRRFRLAIADIRNGDQARKLTGQPGPRSAQERIDEIHAIAGRAAIEQTALKDKPRYSEIVKTVDESGPENRVIEANWRPCSGFAHATGGRR